MGYDPGRFLNSPGEFWTCPKCTLILRDPVQICDNSHSICSSCSLSAVFHQCPAAGCSGIILDETNRRPDATASRFLSSQTIRCENGSDADAACDWVGPLAAENMHAITCVFVATGCPHTGCTFRARSSALPTHLRTCPYRLVRCTNANLNTLGGSPRKGCAYKGPLNTMDQHLVECNHNPCPQACYGCLFTNTMATVEQHASECKDLLFQELCELRKRVASQQGPTPPTGPPVFRAAQPGGTSNDVVYHRNQMDQEAAPLLMTPPSTDIPSSELGANEQTTFDATVIPEDPNARQRSTSILDLDVDIEDPMEDTQPSAMDRNSASDEDMEDGEVNLFGDGPELIIETVSEGEEENMEENESGEEDVLREIGIKTEIQDRGGRGIAIYVTENVRRPDLASSDSNIPVSPPFQQGSDTPTISSPSKASVHARIAAESLDNISKDAPNPKRKSRRPPSKSVPRVATPISKASDQPSSQVKYPPNSDPPTVCVNTTMNSSTVLGYGYMEGGQIFPRPMVPHDPPQERSRDEAPPRTSRIKMVRDVRPPPPLPEVDTFGPVRTNMHRRNNAISHTRGSHPYLSSGVHPRQIPPGPPNGSGPGRHGPAFPLPAKPPFMEEQYRLPHALRGPGDYQRYPPTAPVPPPYIWPSRQYVEGPPIPAPAHLRGYPPQMRRDFEREGFEASREYHGTFDTRMAHASSRRPFSTYPIEADYVHPQYSMHTYQNLATEDTQSCVAWREMHHYPPSWSSYDAASREHTRRNIEDFSHSLPVSQQNAGPSHPSISTILPTQENSDASDANATEGTALELHSRSEAKSASPVVVSVPPQKRPPKVSATPFKPIDKISQPAHFPDTEKGTHTQRETFTPSLLAQPPIEYLQELSGKKTHHIANAVHDDTPNVGESSDEDQPLAQKLSAARKPQPPQKQSPPLVAHKRKKSTKSPQASVEAKTAGLHKEPEETPSTNVSESRTSSPTKRPTTTKGRFVHVPEEEFLARDTLVDRPPKLFRKRITRSGKEFHSGDDESKSDVSDDPGVAVESPERQDEVPAVRSPEAQMSQAMETVRSPSGIKTRGLKAVRKISSRTKSAVQLAIPMICGPTEDETTIPNHSHLSEASSKDLFVPTRRAAGEVNSGDSSLLELKLANPRGRGRGRGRGIGRGRGKAEAWGPQSARNIEEELSMQYSEDAAGSGIQEQVGDVDPVQGMFLSGSTASSLSFPISHSRTTVIPSKDAPKPSPVTPSRLLAAHTAAQTTLSTGTLSFVDLFSGMDTSSISPVHSAVMTSIAPSSTWNAYALTSQLGTDEDSGLASSMDFEFDPVEQLQLDEWTNLASYSDTMNSAF